MRIPAKAADVVGVLALGIFAAGAAWVVGRLYGSATGVWSWCLGFPALAIVALFVWHSEKWPHDVGGAFMWSVGSVVIGITFFGIDLMIGTGFAPNLPIRYAVWQSGGPLGIAATIVVCPGLTLIFLAGTVRELLLAERQPVPPKAGKYVFLKLGK
ncbi:MAG: hypothetical protein WBQ34_15045 [Candidatus Acidiferrales bacterium]